MLFKALVTLLFGSEWKLKQRIGAARHPLARRLMIRLWGALQYECGSSVAWNARFANEPCFPHGIKSIFISGAAIVGRNAVIFQQVTIGSNTLAGSKGFGAPKVGDNCHIGAGARIVGNVRVGNNVRIGANAVVHEDVPDNSIVLSGEQRTVPGREGMDNRFSSFRGQWCWFDEGSWRVVSDPAVLAQLAEAADRGVSEGA
jgi:serine O-acetyltransferase